MSQIIHIQTQITTTLGRLDDAGNVVEMRQATSQPLLLSPGEFGKAAREILDARDRWQEEQHGDQPSDSHSA